MKMKLGENSIIYYCDVTKTQYVYWSFYKTTGKQVCRGCGKAVNKSKPLPKEMRLQEAQR